MIGGDGQMQPQVRMNRHVHNHVHDHVQNPMHSHVQNPMPMQNHLHDHVQNSMHNHVQNPMPMQNHVDQRVHNRMQNHVHQPVHNPVLLHHDGDRVVWRPQESGFCLKSLQEGHEQALLELDRSRRRMEEEQSSSFLEVMEVMEERVKVMSMMQETRQMLQAKERGELVGLVNEEECRAKVMALQQCVDQLRKFPESPRNLESPRPDVSQAGTLDTEYTEDQEGEDEEEEEPVDESLELFLREAWREEMVEFIRTIKKEFKKCQKEKQNLEFEMQELREDNSRRERESMEEKRKLRAKVGNLQCKLNALTGKNGGSPGGSSGSGGSSPPKPPVSKVSIETQTEPEVVEEDVDVSNVEIKPWTNDEMLKVLKKMQMERAVREANAPKKVTDLELGRDVKDAFSKRAGTNIQLSKDHMIATRVDEVQSQAVVFGSSPIRKEAFGWYYSVEVKAMTSRIWGGLAVGVTQIRPRSFQELPNKGWELEDTCLVGYWTCCAFVNRMRQRVQWDPADLRVGNRVGVLVTNEGDLKIFVDRMEVDCLKGAGCPTTSPDELT